MSEMPSLDIESQPHQTEIEDLHVRNYDDTEHVLWVRALTDGECVFERSYRLAGGASASELAVFDSGRYDIEVELDGLRRWVDNCTLGNDPSAGILVETGNGTVSITTHDSGPDVQKAD